MYQPSYRTQAAHFGASFKHTGGVKRAADAWLKKDIIAYNGPGPILQRYFDIK